MRWVLGLLDAIRHGNTARDDAHVSGPERERRAGKRLRRAENEARPSEKPAGKPGEAPRELGVGSPELDDERLAGGQCGKRRRKPVGMHEVDTRGGPASRPGIGEQEQRHHNRQPRAPPEVPDDPVTVREPEVAERSRRDHGDFDPGSAQMLDRVLDEHPGDVLLRARVRRRQNEDFHPPSSARREKTTGTATASTANT